MAKITVEYEVKCKRCNKPIAYSGAMYEKMKQYGHSRPEYCEDCRRLLIAERLTMGAAYYALRLKEGADESAVLPGELGKVYHPERPHVRVERPQKFEASKFGATPDKIVEIYEWLKEPEHQVVIVEGGTGSGKSSALPYWLLEPPDGVPHDFFTRDGQIVITQPKIIATTKVTGYLGTLLGSSVGKGFDIGYRHSGDKNADSANAAFIATDGTLINLIMKGDLSRISLVLIDEAHERSLNIDIILLLLRELLPLYPHLKVMIVSATINAQQFLDYFGRQTAKLVQFEAKRKFSYKTYFASEKERLPYHDLSRLRGQLVPAVVKKALWLLEEQVSGRWEKGDILAFLQGVRPIEEAVASLRSCVEANPRLRGKVDVFPLYSALDDAETSLAVDPSSSGKIKVIFSTNVAEASITVEGVVYEIETGVENQAQWDSEVSQKSVELNLISKANARQRWGRTGRTREGEVFCLYTEDQFAQMPDFPVPAIRRSSMQEIVLKLKEFGFDDVDLGWIDAPEKKELERSLEVLRKSGAIDERGNLTEYGAVLAQFSYPPQLVDLILMADRFGCAVEVATILPVIKREDGYRSFLIRKPDWDETTRQHAIKAQNALWAGCKDDVEFILRMFDYWENPPGVAGVESGHNLASRRDRFAEAFYVDFQVFEDINSEREKILRQLTGHRKDRRLRKFQPELLNRVRSVLAYSIDCQLVSGEAYAYRNSVVWQSDEQAMCWLSMPEEKLAAVWALRGVNCSPMRLATVFDFSLGEPPEKISKRLLSSPKLPNDDKKMFESFVSRFKVGQELMVEVTGYAVNPGNSQSLLVVRDTSTELEIWMTVADLCFGQSATLVRQVPIGSRLRVVVCEINRTNQTVRVSRLPLLAKELEALFEKEGRRGGQVSARAKVWEVDPVGKRIVFLAESFRPETGSLLVVYAGEKALEKALSDYREGDVCTVSFRAEFADHSYWSNLPSPDNKLLAYLKQNPESGLSWSEGRLYFGGKMSPEKRLALLLVSDNSSYVRAIERLFLLSNTAWAGRVFDTGWLQKVQKIFPVGAVCKARVRQILGAGALLDLEGGQAGFVDAGNVNPNRRTTYMQTAVEIGELYQVKVIGHDEDRRQVRLSLAIPENSPERRYRVGQTIEGIVDNLTDYGAFVSLGLGYSGLIHVSRMGRGINKPSDMLSKGDLVTVDILEIKKDRDGKVTVSLALRAVVRKNA